MNKLLLILLALITFHTPAFAQLGGTDTKPGDACTAAEEGYVRRNASADRDASEITLMCDGFQWQSATGGGGGSWEDVPLTDTADYDTSCHYRAQVGSSSQVFYATRVTPSYIFAVTMSTSGTDNEIRIAKETRANYSLRDENSSTFTTAGASVVKLEKFCGGGGGSDTLAGLSCSSGDVAKWNGTTWACAADDAGGLADNAVTNAKMADDAVGIPELSATGTASASTYLRGDNTWATISTGLPSLTSANIWVGNATNVATAVSLSGDATITNAGVLTIGANAVGSAEISDLSITNSDIANATIVATTKLSATGTKSSATFLRGDNTWAAIPASVTVGTLCGVSEKAGCNISCSSSTGYTNVALCGGSNPASACPAGYAIITVDKSLFSGGTCNTGDDTVRTCTRHCRKT